MSTNSLSTSHVQGHLCAKCKSIQISQMLLKSTPHQPTFLKLRISAENGCQLCQFLCMSLEQGF